MRAAVSARPSTVECRARQARATAFHSCDPAALHAGTRSDSGTLATCYRRLGSKLYLHGERNGLPAHIGRVLDAAEVVEVPRSGRFPMTDLPERLWQAVSAAVDPHTTVAETLPQTGVDGQGMMRPVRPNTLRGQ